MVPNNFQSLIVYEKVSHMFDWRYNVKRKRKHNCDSQPRNRDLDFPSYVDNDPSVEIHFGVILLLMVLMSLGKKQQSLLVNV